jgi:hypothetical protein
MNCANHPQNPVAAYCRTCGKAVCASCTRQVMGVIYCENCLAERVSGSAPPPSIAPYHVYRGPAQPVTGPNPALAGILAGFFPLGVGAVYCGQYAKALAHCIIFVLLIVGVSHSTSDSMATIFGLGIAAFYFYQLIDAIKSAKAIQMGQPAPDPFGLGSMFTTGEKHEIRPGVPSGAVILIVLGVLFLLHNLGPWYLSFDIMWPLLLVALGAWLFVKRRVASEERHRSLTGPVLLVTIGALWLISNLHGPNGWNTWPLILLILGVIQLYERGYLGGHPPLPPPSPPPSTSTHPPEPQAPSEFNTEVKNG